MKYAVLITGGRDYDDVDTVERIVSTFPPGTFVVTGKATGADTLADKEATAQQKPTAGIPYFHWLGKAGGPARNQLMVDVLKSLQDAGWLVKVVVFPGGRGTADCVKRAEAAGLPVQYV